MTHLHSRQAHVKLVDEDRSLLDEHRAKLREIAAQVAKIGADTRAQIAADEEKRQVPALVVLPVTVNQSVNQSSHVSSPRTRLCISNTFLIMLHTVNGDTICP